MEDNTNGLNDLEVLDRIKKGLINYDDTPKTKSILKIIKDNTLNYFVLINMVLGLVVILSSIKSGTGLEGLKNCLFLGIVIINSIISIVEEIISKRIIDKLSIINESKATVIRNGKEIEISVYELVKDDIILYKSGNQIATDSIILKGDLEVNESYITGESDSISKKINDTLLSGSFVISGNAIAKVVNVGKNNYISKISSAAKYDKKLNSVILNSFERLLKVLSIIIIPIGIIMYFIQLKVTGSNNDSILASVAAVVGMIPNGLVLLTSSVMAVGVIKLYKSKVLVQELYAIELLARIDTICLDKTGTLTEGKIKVIDIIPNNHHNKEELEELLNIYSSSTIDPNSTILALKKKYNGKKEEVNNKILFSSSKKYSALEFNNYSLFLGAPSIIKDKNTDNIINDYIDKYRVIVLGKKNGKIDNNLSNIDIIGYVLLEDVIRKNAKETLKFFKDNNVSVKIISGDSSKTVISIAKRLDMDNIKGIDIGNLTKREVEKISEEYQVFGRVNPEQKKWIVSYLKSKGHVVGMTGDGVNDVMALKESDCAISIKSGTDAARNVSHLILLDDDFNSIPKVVKEGRQIINNIGRSSSLLLVKTLYTMLLIIFSILVPQKYFFIPIQLTLITQVTIGIPSFVLGLEPNNELVEGNFLLKIIKRSLPVSITVLYNIIIVSLFVLITNMGYEIQSTLSVYLTSITGLIFLISICRPFTFTRKILITSLSLGFLIAIIFFPSFFNLVPINITNLLITFILSTSSIFILKLCTNTIEKLFKRYGY